MAFLVDTNVLVYRYDPRFPDKQARSTSLLRDGLSADEARLAHQTVLEFVAATTRPIRRNGPSLLERADALREADELISAFRILYPVEPLLRLALRGCSVYGLSWFDAHMWAYAEFYGVPLLLSEDFQHNRVYGTVRVVDPFLNED